MSVASGPPPASNESDKVTHQVPGLLANTGAEGPAERGSMGGYRGTSLIRNGSDKKQAFL